MHRLGGARLPFAVASVLAALVMQMLLVIGRSAPGTAACPPPSPPTAPEAVGHAITSEARRTVLPRTGALRDRRALQLCGLMALSCAALRACFDALLPLWLGTRHAFSVGQISHAMQGAAAGNIVASAGAGYLTTRFPRSLHPMVSGAAVATGLAAAALLLFPTGLGISLAFCGFFALSSFLNVAGTSALEARGREAIGRPDDLMALQTGLYSLGFAAGGLLSVVATAGSGCALRQRTILAGAGAVTTLYALVYWCTGQAEPVDHDHEGSCGD